jgi:hypothetical protein
VAHYLRFGMYVDRKASLECQVAKEVLINGRFPESATGKRANGFVLFSLGNSFFVLEGCLRCVG